MLSQRVCAPAPLEVLGTNHYPATVCYSLPARVWTPCPGYVAVQAVHIYIYTVPGLRGIEYPASVPCEYPAKVIPLCTGCAVPQGVEPITLGTWSTHKHPASICCSLPARVWILCAGYVTVQAVHMYTLSGLSAIQNPANVPWIHPANGVPPCTGCCIAPQDMAPSTLGALGTNHYHAALCCSLPARVWIPCPGYVAVQAVHMYTLPGLRGIQYPASVPC